MPRSCALRERCLVLRECGSDGLNMKPSLGSTNVRVSTPAGGRASDRWTASVAWRRQARACCGKSAEQTKHVASRDPVPRADGHCSAASARRSGSGMLLRSPAVVPSRSWNTACGAFRQPRQWLDPTPFQGARMRSGSCVAQDPQELEGWAPTRPPVGRSGAAQRRSPERARQARPCSRGHHATRSRQGGRTRGSWSCPSQGHLPASWAMIARRSSSIGA